MQMITTKYLGSTNNLGSRIRAVSAGGAALTLPVNHSFSDGRCQTEAASALCRRLDWSDALGL